MSSAFNTIRSLLPRHQSHPPGLGEGVDVGAADPVLLLDRDRVSLVHEVEFTRRRPAFRRTRGDGEDAAVDAHVTDLGLVGDAAQGDDGPLLEFERGGIRRRFSFGLSRARVLAARLSACYGNWALVGSGRPNKHMSNKDFKIPYGERDGDLRHISEVERGLKCQCVCPVCSERLVARKGQKVEHHFGHYPGANCSAETVLHQIGKRLLYRRIAAAIADGTCLPITWPCLHCHDQHEGNLVKLAHTAEMEMHLGACRPDLAILKPDGTPVAFVEIVVSHPPDENVLAYAAAHSVTVVEFHLNSADELEVLGQSPTLKATRVDLCTRPKCAACGRPLHRKVLHVVDGECWKCNAPMKIAMLNVEGVAEAPENFSGQDRAVASEHGAVLKTNYSRTLREKYLSSTCGRCGAFVGTFFLHDYWHLMTAENGHATGHMCLECNRHY